MSFACSSHVLGNQLVPGPGVILWAGGREGLAEPVDPESLAAFHPAWAKDAHALAPWQEILRPWPEGCSAESWWISPTSARLVRSSVVVCGPCSSVLDVIRPLAECGACFAWDSVLGVKQWAGRGQLRRRWESPAGNLYAAMVLPKPPERFDTLVPLLVGHCLAEYFRSRGSGVALKWPNDILQNNAKVAGVLVEERRGHLLAGIGINLVSAPPAARLREGFAIPAGVLSTTISEPTPLGLWLELVNFVRNCYQKCLQIDTAESLAYTIEQSLAWRGELVEVLDGGDPPRRGRLSGIDPDGALRLVPEDGYGTAIRLVSGSIWPLGPE